MLGITKSKFSLAILFTVLAILCGGAASAGFRTMQILYANTGYFFMLGLFVVWLLSLIWLARRESFSLLEWLKQHRIALLIIAAICAVSFFTVGPGYRVLSDETNLVSVSRSMALDKKVYNTIMGKWYYDAFYALQEELPTRPIMYPFLASIVHSVTGYRYQNAFYTNGIIGLIFLVMVYGCLVLRFAPVLSLGVIFLMASQPLFGLCLSSAGFEMANLLFLALPCFLAFLYTRKPSDECFLALWYSLIMSAHVRYENPIYLAIIAAVLFYGNKLDFKQVWRQIHHICLGALLLVPRIWQAQFAGGNYENGDQALLDPMRIPKRAYEYIDGLFNLGFKLPYAGLSNIFAAILVIAAVVLYIRSRKWERRSSHSGMFWLMLGLCVASYTLITMSHFLATPQHPAVFRLFMIPTLFLCAAVCFIFDYLPRRTHVAFLLVCVSFFLSYIPVTSKRELTNTLTLIRSTNEVYGYLDRLNDPRTLIIIDRPGQYTVRNIGAVDFGFANANSSELIENLRRKLINHIVVVQDVDYATLKPRQTLPDTFVLRPTYEFQHDGITKIVISEVVPQF